MFLLPSCLFQAPNPPSGTETNTTLQIVVVSILLLIIGLVVFIWIQRNTHQPVKRPLEPIFPQYEKKDPSVAMLWEQQAKVRTGGLIEAGIQMEKIETEAGRFVLYTSTEPVTEFASFLEMGKPVYITAWLNNLDDKNKELARVRVQIQKQSKKELVTGNVQEKMVLEFMQFEIKDGEVKNKIFATKIILGNVEKWSDQFSIEQSVGSVQSDLWTDDFIKREYQMDAQGDRSVKFIKMYSRNKKN